METNTVEDIKLIAARPIRFTLVNPTPEISQTI